VKNVAETVGSLIDKISIVELKIFNMQKQTERMDATAEHRDNCAKRVVVLKEQRDDLVSELNALTKDVISGVRKIKIYRQFKMYNDPTYKTQAK
jgi:uncharacterized coiled-coil DUF342 family protein